MNKISPAVSVIIPVYNAEVYFSDIIKKVINQTLSNIEIIVIDDCSTDNTYDLICKYSASDSRVTVLKNEKNSGAGVSRNKGLLVASGEYVIFLDDDDFVEEDMLEKLFITASEHKTDVVVFRSQFSDWHTKAPTNTPWTIREDLLPSADVFSAEQIQHDFFRAFVWWPWDKFYNREHLLATGIFFQEIRTSNDLYFTASQMLLANRIAIFPEILIHHSISREASLENTRERSWQCALEALTELRHFLNDRSLYSSRGKDFKNYCLSFLKWNIDTLSGQSYFDFFDGARKFIISCDINVSDIYEDELSFFYEDMMKSSPQEYVFKVRNILFSRCRYVEAEWNDAKFQLEIANENVAIANKNVEIANENIENKKDELTAHKKLLETLNSEYAVVKNALGSERRQNSLLNDQVEDLKVKINEIEQSKSWRYTRILRCLIQIFR